MSDAKHLLVIRHGHAHATLGKGGDRERGLASHGVDAVTQLGRWIVERGWPVDRVLASSARRCEETVNALVGEFPAVPPLDFQADLYLAPWSTLLTFVRACDDAVRTLVVVAHNPGVWELASRLAAGSKRTVEVYSPATCAVFAVHSDWARLDESVRLLALRGGGDPRT